MLDELLEKLKSSFNFPEEDLRITRDEFHAIGERVEIERTVRAVPNDPDDNKFVECALAGRATFVVSGDRHLLGLDTYE